MSSMASPDADKRALAVRWLEDETIELSADERSLLTEYVERYPTDPTLTRVDKRRLAREFALLAGRLSSD